MDLKDRSQWQGFSSKDELVDRMNAKLSHLGVSFNFSQNIEDNVEEAVTGVKGEMAVKLYGDDLNTLTTKAQQIQSVMERYPA